MFLKPKTYTESIQVDAAGISVKVLKMSLPMEASRGLSYQNKEESADSILAGETSLAKLRKSKDGLTTSEGMNPKRE